MNSLQRSGSAAAAPLVIGLAIGHGTGHELANAFRHVTQHVSAFYGISVIFVTSPRLYHSYASLLSVPDQHGGAHKQTKIDADHYEDFCIRQSLEGMRVIFRLSVSAQALYDVRQRLCSCRVERYNQGPASMLVVRDQSQGFYTGTSSYDPATELVSRICHFKKDVMGRLVDYSIHRAKHEWHGQGPDSVTLVYKHHLFDGIFDVWAHDWSQRHGIAINFVQPDTMNRNLLAFGIQGRQLVISGNEYSDIMQVFMLKLFGGEVQETSCAENVFLHPKLNGLTEYQTVHGSADDLEGKGIVNPTATIRAAAAILERFGCCEGLMTLVDSTIRTLRRNNQVTPDQGGMLDTKAFVDAFMGRFGEAMDATKNGRISKL